MYGLRVNSSRIIPLTRFTAVRENQRWLSFVGEEVAVSLPTDNGEIPLLSEHHVRLDGHPEISLVVKIQNQVQALNETLCVVQLHIVNF